MKDPAFLFYTNDFQGGTIDMSCEEIGAYLRQHLKCPVVYGRPAAACLPPFLVKSQPITPQHYTSDSLMTTLFHACHGKPSGESSVCRNSHQIGRAHV